MNVGKCNPLAYTAPELLRRLGPGAGGGSVTAGHESLPVPSLRVDARRLTLVGSQVGRPAIVRLIVDIEPAMSSTIA